MQKAILAIAIAILVASQRSPLGDDCGTSGTTLDGRPHVLGLGRLGTSGVVICPCALCRLTHQTCVGVVYVQDDQEQLQTYVTISSDKICFDGLLAYITDAPHVGPIM